MVPQSSSQIFLIFISSPKDQDANVTLPNSVYGKTSLDVEANSNVQYIRWHFSEAWLYDFEKPKHTQTRRSATKPWRLWRSRCARVKRQLLGKWPRGRPHLRGLLLLCACVHAGANLRPNLKTTSGEEISCPDLSLRSGRNTFFLWIFRSWKLLEPTFVSTCNVHISYCGKSCINQDLWPTLGYHKQWPYRLSACSRTYVHRRKAA